MVRNVRLLGVVPPPPPSEVPVALKVTLPSPATVAVAVLVPAAGPTVRRACDRPLASVGSLRGVIEPPPAVTAQVTVIPATGFPALSSTRTTKSCASAVPTGAAWPSPLTETRAVGTPPAGLTGSPPVQLPRATTNRPRGRTRLRESRRNTEPRCFIVSSPDVD